MRSLIIFLPPARRYNEVESRASLGALRTMLITRFGDGIRTVGRRSAFPPQRAMRSSARDGNDRCVRMATWWSWGDAQAIDHQQLALAVPVFQAGTCSGPFFEVA